MTAMLMPSLGPMELLLILVIVLVVFGASRLPQLGKGLGEGIRNFKKGVAEGEAEDRKTPQPPPG
jgi:sec-independent protein translocase protein TatA